MNASGDFVRDDESDSDSGSLRSTRPERNDSPHAVTRFPSSSLCLKAFKGECNANDDDEDSSHATSVRFENNVTVRFTRSFRDYSPRQIRDCWYQSYELSDIKTRCVEDLKISQSGRDNGQANEEACCTRGLEAYDEFVWRQKFRLRAQAANTVFDAEDEGYDDVAIAKLCSAVTARSQTWANIVGIRDERTAASVYNEARGGYWCSH